MVERLIHIPHWDQALLQAGIIQHQPTYIDEWRVIAYFVVRLVAKSLRDGYIVYAECCAGSYHAAYSGWHNNSRILIYVDGQSPAELSEMFCDSDGLEISDNICIASKLNIIF